MRAAGSIFDIKHKGGQFPCHIETCNDPEVARWLSSVLCGQYFAEHPEVVETSQRIERGELDYKEHEAVVKYETAYQIFAGRGRMFGVYDPRQDS